MHNQEPKEPASTEARILTDLGYAHVLGNPVPASSPGAEPDVLAENFLDAYPDDSPHRQETEDLLTGYLAMDPSDPDYPATRRHILRYVETWFGPPEGTS
jgi:hypothetical protein